MVHQTVAQSLSLGLKRWRSLLPVVFSIQIVCFPIGIEGNSEGTSMSMNIFARCFFSRAYLRDVWYQISRKCVRYAANRKRRTGQFVFLSSLKSEI